MDYSIDLIDNLGQLDSIYDLFVEYNHELKQTHLANSLCKLRSYFEKDHQFWHAYSGEKELGFTFGKGNGEVYLSEGVYVAFPFRRQGIATALKNAQITYAKMHGCSQMRTSFNFNNIASRKLQAKLGCEFEPDGTTILVKLDLRTEEII